MRAIEPNAWEVISESPEATEGLGAALGAMLRAGDIVCLRGGMGAGKTTLSRGIGAGFGALQAPTSPTYNLVHEHERAQDALRLYHIDLYRIGRAQEAATLGLDDIFDGGGIVLIEWPQIIADHIEGERLFIDIEAEGISRRRLRLTACGASLARRITGLAADAQRGAACSWR